MSGSFPVVHAAFSVSFCLFSWFYSYSFLIGGACAGVSSLITLTQQLYWESCKRASWASSGTGRVSGESGWEALTE